MGATVTLCDGTVASATRSQAAGWRNGLPERDTGGLARTDLRFASEREELLAPLPVCSHTSNTGLGNRDALSRARTDHLGGNMKSKLFAGLVAAAAVGAFTAASALAGPVPQLWTDSTKTTPLRSVHSTPVNQPDALEFQTDTQLTPLEFGWNEPTGASVEVICNEVEFGTTVVSNSPEGELTSKENKLALPFGVAENDNCHDQGPGTTGAAPVYFDTNAAGAVPANITLGAGPVGHIHKLKFSIDVDFQRWCTVTVAEGTPVEFANATAGFVEESLPNLIARIPLTAVSNISVLCTRPGEKTTKIKGRMTAEFFLETMSTLTDTAFIE
jgi:hypothetical protein